MSEESDQKEIYAVPSDHLFYRITPACPYCSHKSLYFYTQRPLKIRCAHCERRFNVDIKLIFEPTKHPIESSFGSSD